MRCRLIVKTDEISPDEGGPLALLVGEILIAWAESGNGNPHTLRVKRDPDSDTPAPGRGNRMMRRGSPVSPELRPGTR